MRKFKLGAGRKRRLVRDNGRHKGSASAGSLETKKASTAMDFLPAAIDYPKELHVTNEIYTVKFDKEFADYGETDPDARVIKIKGGMSRRATFATFVHEVLHMIEFEHGIKLKHKVVYELERAIVELLLDNFFQGK